MVPGVRGSPDLRGGAVSGFQSVEPLTAVTSSFALRGSRTLVTVLGPIVGAVGVTPHPWSHDGDADADAGYRPRPHHHHCGLPLALAPTAGRLSHHCHRTPGGPRSNRPRLLPLRRRRALRRFRPRPPRRRRRAGRSPDSPSLSFSLSFSTAGCRRPCRLHLLDGRQCLRRSLTVGCPAARIPGGRLGPCSLGAAGAGSGAWKTAGTTAAAGRGVSWTPSSVSAAENSAAGGPAGRMPPGVATGFASPLALAVWSPRLRRQLWWCLQHRSYGPCPSRWAQGIRGAARLRAVVRTLGAAKFHVDAPGRLLTRCRRGRTAAGSPPSTPVGLRRPVGRQRIGDAAVVLTQWPAPALSPAEVTAARGGNLCKARQDIVGSNGRGSVPDNQGQYRTSGDLRRTVRLAARASRRKYADPSWSFAGPRPARRPAGQRERRHRLLPHRKGDAPDRRLQPIREIGRRCPNDVHRRNQSVGIRRARTEGAPGRGEP